MCVFVVYNIQVYIVYLVWGSRTEGVADPKGFPIGAFWCPHWSIHVGYHSIRIKVSPNQGSLIDMNALTPSLRRPFKHAIFFSTACRTACKHAFRFLRVLPEAVSTRHSWLWQTLDDVYTRRCFSESEGTRFGAPGQKALPSVNEFTLLWIFA